MAVSIDSEALAIAPEDYAAFRYGQLLLLLQTFYSIDASGIHLERLCYYDFFAANPHLLIPDGDPQRSRFIMAGFDPAPLSYASPGQRFSSRRERIQHDLSILVGYSLVVVSHTAGRVAYCISDDGRLLASRFSALYARGYSQSAEMVIGRLRKLSDSRLRDEARRWLRAPEALLDIIDRTLPGDAVQ